MTDHFTASLRQLNELVNKDLEMSIISSPRSTRGDIQTVAQIEGIDDDSTEYLDTTQTTVQAINDNGEVYAEVIIHTLKKDPTVALLDWVEVVDAHNRGHGVGRTLHEEAVQYIENELGVTKTYTKVENSKMQSVNIDTGFRQIDAPSNEPWYRRD